MGDVVHELQEFTRRGGGLRTEWVLGNGDWEVIAGLGNREFSGILISILRNCIADKLRWLLHDIINVPIYGFF